MDKKKNVSMIIFTILLFSTSFFSLMGVSKDLLTYTQDSFIAPIIYDYPNVMITLDIEGRAIGQELLWKANTTGTNYEESAVTFLDGIAYVGSCSTHGDGHDKLFAINTTNGEILWSKETGPGYVGPIIDDDVIYMGTSTHCHEPGNEFMYAVNRFTGKEIWKRQIFGGIPESVQFDED
ncbi:PQQ-binding-like beta-propeller repeat protein, partial [Romboutsia sp.]|uniref:outer membrane protein assembly factor BamB family protein n=1 Tax=Romboutsia sp. TaxID=1965302 RepID=UPI002BED3C59